jgi:glycine/D-amino acid oxidase-like deaminating enzyme
VDPSLVVKALRHKAEESEVNFVGGANVTSLQRDDSGRIVGVTFEHTGKKAAETLIADVVVVAAGVGSSLDALGGLPLAHSPGQIAYAKSSSKAASLSRILVDTVRESHVLMRRDGTIVAGGGYLQVGGLASSYSVTDASTRSLETATDKGSVLLEQARGLAPAALGAAVYTHFAQAPRPMPKDGWPAVGYLEDGLYVAVTHSGVTLAPIIGASVAAELSRGISLDLLRPYRPARLFSEHIEAK